MFASFSHRRFTAGAGRCAAAAAMLPLLATASCGQADGGPTRIQPASNFWIADVPIPRGFSLNEKKSSVERDATARRVDHLYEGGGEPNVIRSFYWEQMPSHQWDRGREELRAGVYTLSFNKGGETCMVTIRKGGGGALFSPAQIRVQLSPGGGGGATAAADGRDASAPDEPQDSTGQQDE